MPDETEQSPPQPTGYVAIAEYYQQRIEDGKLAPGDALPSLRFVAEKFGVARMTAVRAYDQLRAEGLTQSRPGRWTIVANPRAMSTGAARIDRLTRTGNAYAPGETSTDHTSALRSVADPYIAEQLGLELYDEVVMRQRTFRRDGRPTAVGFSIINMRALVEVPELLTQGSLKPFWQRTYELKTGRKITRSPESRIARLASADELAALEIGATPEDLVPVLVTNTLFGDERGPIEVWEDVYAPGQRQTDTRR